MTFSRRSISVSDRRDDSRRPCSLASDLLVVSDKASSPSRFASVTITDLSSTGAAALTDAVPPRDAALYLDNEQFRAQVRMKNLTMLKTGLRAGFEFVGEVEWKAKQQPS